MRSLVHMGSNNNKNFIPVWLVRNSIQDCRGRNLPVSGIMHNFKP